MQTEASARVLDDYKESMAKEEEKLGQDSQPNQSHEEIVGYVSLDNLGQCRAYSTKKDFQFQVST